MLRRKARQEGALAVWVFVGKRREGNAVLLIVGGAYLERVRLWAIWGNSITARGNSQC